MTEYKPTDIESLNTALIGKTIKAIAHNTSGQDFSSLTFTLSDDSVIALEPFWCNDGTAILAITALHASSATTTLAMSDR